jgi:putative ABC transport system substrate-binding protein
VRRRTFLVGLGGAAAWPLVTRAQQPSMPVIGFLSGRSPDESSYLIQTFRQGLKETGYDEGRNVAIEYRWARGQYDRLPALAAELVARPVSVIVSVGGSSLAAKAATTTIPIVITEGNDPVASGLVQSLNRPGGNLTGVMLYGSVLPPKRLELLRETVPGAKLIAILGNPSTPSSVSQSNVFGLASPDRPIAEVRQAEVRDAQKVADLAERLGQRILVLNASSAHDLEPAFATMIAQGANALLVMNDPFLDGQRTKLVALANDRAIPAIYAWREFAELGGLMSYGINIAESYHQLGLYAGKVLNGANPAELPVLQPVKFDLVINLKTAKALSLTIPPSLLVRADEVIE